MAAFNAYDCGNSNLVTVDATVIINRTGAGTGGHVLRAIIITIAIKSAKKNGQQKNNLSTKYRTLLMRVQ